MKLSLRERLKRLPKPVLIGVPVAVGALVIGAAVFLAVHNFSPTVLKGLDVSNYQGNISWRAVKESGNIKFVYMKATEGKAYRDAYFSKNWEGAQKNGIPVGAYHFYSESSSGRDQADNFIATVPKEKGKLPPAIDIEISVAKQSDFKAQLATYVQMITSHYGQKPIFYVPPTVYNLLYDDYYNYQFWIINYDSNPDVKGWTFWQYSDKGTMPGIDGKIDLDQYRGSLWDFGKLLSK